MTTQLYNTLKNQLTTSEDFSEIFDFFFQNFAENSSFYEQGEFSKNEMLIATVKAVGKKFYGEKCDLSDYRMTEIAEQNFIHGTCFLDGNLVLAIYFTDINVGLASISMGGAQFNFVHLKASKIPEGWGVQFSKEKERTVN